MRIQEVVFIEKESDARPGDIVLKNKEKKLASVTPKRGCSTCYGKGFVTMVVPGGTNKKSHSPCSCVIKRYQKFVGKPVISTSLVTRGR